MAENTDLKEIAVVMKTGEPSLTWADLLTLCTSPSTRVSELLQKCFFGVSGVGWLSKSTIDAFLSILIEETNKKSGTTKFGCLNCDNTSLVINGKLLKFCATIESSLTIYAKDSKRVLRDNLLLVKISQIVGYLQ